MSLPQANLLYGESPMETSFALDTLTVSVIKFLKKDALNKAIYMICHAYLLDDQRAIWIF